MKSTLRVRFAGRDLELTCEACGFSPVQPVRDPIAERCPRCRRKWRG